ncbi:MAG: hypothetical protein AAGF44_05425 [Pseudomonadota bacterium]
MRYDAPFSFGLGSIASIETIILAAVIPIVIALMLGLNRETAVVAGVLSALTMIAFR